MSLLNLIGDLANAGYSAKLNPSTVNSQGQLVDSKGNPTTLWQQPGWFARGFSSTAQDIERANMQASSSPLLAQQALLAQEAQNRGLPVASAQGNINAANLVGQQPTGTVGMMAGLGSFNPAGVGEYNQVQARNNAGTYPAEAQAQTAQAGTIAAQNPSSAYPLISQNVMREQQFGVPYRQMSDELQSLNPGLGSSALNIGHIDPITGRFTSIRNPVQSMQGVLLGNSGILGGPVTGPSGASYTRPPTDISVPPLNQGFNDSWNGSPPQAPSIPATGNLKPVGGLKGYQTDDDGNVFYNGTFVPPENLKGTQLEKVVNSQKTFEKNLKDYHATHALPHGLGFELGRVIPNAYNNSLLQSGVQGASNLIGRAYHGLIGE